MTARTLECGCRFAPCALHGGAPLHNVRKAQGEVVERGVYSNQFQGAAPKALFVCSAGMLRSATAAHIFATEGWNTRCAGIEDYAVQPVHANTLAWADAVYCMTEEHSAWVLRHHPRHAHKCRVLGVPDTFSYREPELVATLRARLKDDA